MLKAIKKAVRPVGKPVQRAYRESRARVLSLLSPMRGVAASAETITGWIADDAAIQMAQASFNLPDNPTIVEIGVFMGRSTVLLAKPRQMRGSGIVHCVDPFDCSGDDYSTPHYDHELREAGADSLEAVFLKNMAKQNLLDWIQVHKGTSAQVVADWSAPIDLLMLNGDHSAAGAREAYESWMPFVKTNGLVILNNTRDRTPGHDGNTRVAEERLIPPRFAATKWNDHTFAIKCGGG